MLIFANDCKNYPTLWLGTTGPATDFGLVCFGLEEVCLAVVGLVDIGLDVIGLVDTGLDVIGLADIGLKDSSLPEGSLPGSCTALSNLRWLGSLRRLGSRGGAEASTWSSSPLSEDRKHSCRDSGTLQKLWLWSLCPLSLERWALEKNISYTTNIAASSIILLWEAKFDHLSSWSWSYFFAPNQTQATTRGMRTMRITIVTPMIKPRLPYFSTSSPWENWMLLLRNQKFQRT